MLRDAYEDNGDQEPNALKDVGVSLASFYAIEQLSHMRKKGLIVPFTRKGRFARFGTNRGWWGAEGRQFVKPLAPAAAEIFENAGIFGMKSAHKSAASTIGRNAAGAAAIKFGVSKAAGLFIGLTSVQLAWMAGEADIGGYKAVSNAVTRYRGLEMGGYFQDTEAGYTSRQRAVRAITSSQLQARSALGNEAMLMHR